MRIISRRAADWSCHALSLLGRPAPEDLKLVERLLGEPKRHPAGDWVEDQGVAEGGAWLLVSGWAAQARVLSDGRRQIGRFLVPGDIFGLTQAAPPPAGLAALTDVVVADMGRVRKLVAAGRAPALAHAWAAMQSLEQTRAFAHIMRLGRFTAYERTGHLLLELYERLAAAGLTQGPNMPMPLTQEMLADCLGHSVVHLNRMIQQLRRNRLISLEGRRMTFLDLERLAADCCYGAPEPTSLAIPSPGAERNRSV
jgi:CRP-like cAMP-binding protein